MATKTATPDPPGGGGGSSRAPRGGPGDVPNGATDVMGGGAGPADPRPAPRPTRHPRSGRSRRGHSPAPRPSSSSSSSAAAAARHQQRRRPTNYTSQYTPPPDLVAAAAEARAARAKQEASASGGGGGGGGSGSGSGGGGGDATTSPVASPSPSRRKCSSLDRSEEEGDETRRHLRSGGENSPVPVRQELRQRHSYHEQNLLRDRKQREEQKRERQGEREGRRGRSLHEQHLLGVQEEHQGQAAGEQQEIQKRLERRDRHGGNHGEGNHYARRSSQEQAPSASSLGSPGSPGSAGPPGSSRQQQQRHWQKYHEEQRQQEQQRQQEKQSQQQQQQRQSRRSKPKKSSSSSSSSRRPRRSAEESASDDDDPDSSRAERRRIEEYAGKRAMLRLEQELADHSETRGDNGGGGGGGGGAGGMDRRKLARVPQVKKSDLIIGEYLGRGNFCDVFEVVWIPPEQQQQQRRMPLQGAAGGWSSSRTISTHDSGASEDLEASMDSLALSNDLQLVRAPIRGEGMVRSASRRSVSQVAASLNVGPGGAARGRSPGAGRAGGAGTGTGGPDLRGGGRNQNPLQHSSRDPNVLALKCLRPAVRAQPRKFVIGAEDLAHETALLACLDHPNIITLHGRAEGCFSTAFQMRSKGTAGKDDDDPDSGGGGGKRMSDEGYFIVLDRLVATLTDRIDEWRDECRAINGVLPADGSDPPPLPPESTLREHLCKRLKVAYRIADALEYLHSRHVVFRDLKPANVGFDCNDSVKMFDFGFATSIAPLLSRPYEGYGPLTETCGTRRYMAPEVALKLGYGKEVDVYSFGMLLWEICALDKPFDAVQSVDEFHDLVVLKGRRPSLNVDPLWTSSLKNLMCRCWSTDPLDRPTMAQAKSFLCTVLRDMNRAMTEARQGGSGGGGKGGGGGRGGATQQQRQEQGGNFIHKWRRRVSI